jgi:hypothetical protein
VAVFLFGYIHISLNPNKQGTITNKNPNTKYQLRLKFEI